MADINKNVTVIDPFYSTSKGPLDAKMTPAETYEDLKVASRIPAAHRYVGLTVLVLTPSPVEYWLVGGTTNKNWKIKTNSVPTKADLLAISPSACTLGTEMIVQADESNGGKVTKYWVSSFDGTAPVWEMKQYGAAISVEGNDMENNN